MNKRSLNEGYAIVCCCKNRGSKSNYVHPVLGKQVHDLFAFVYNDISECYSCIHIDSGANVFPDVFYKLNELEKYYNKNIDHIVEKIDKMDKKILQEKVDFYNRLISADRWE